MSENEEEQTKEQLVIARYRNSLIKRLNASGLANLDSLPLEALEALSEREAKKEVEKANQKPAFLNINKPQSNPDPTPVENSNQSDVKFKFNSLMIFHPQYQPVENMAKYNNDCTILSMRVNPDPRFPEWQVS